MKSPLALLLLAAMPGLVAAAPEERLQRDLGHGLAYCRVHALPADLPAAAAKPGPLVLDLRYARGADGATTALGAWLKVRCAATTPVFVLVNADTAPAVLAYLAAIEPPAGLITVGAASPRFAPDIALKISAASERAAYDALETGTPVEALLSDHSAKPRHDEASIAQDRTGSPEAPADTGAGPPDSPDPAAGVPAPPPPLTDQALQRAVHLHRALLALRKL
jgi:hypothetical protein